MAQGTLEFVAVEGGCFRLNTDGANYELIGPLAGEIARQENIGNQYSISYIECPDMGSICQVGTIVCVQEFQLIGGDDDCDPGDQVCGANCCKPNEQCCAGVPIQPGEEYCIAENAPGGCPMG
jgi:hypothetical protein